MKKVSELTVAELDYWVARAEGLKKGQTNYVAYSTAWAVGGQIIERERYSFATVGTGMPDENGNQPIVCIGKDCKAMQGPTHLIAAMRCYVASKFGEEVDDSQAHIVQS